MPHASPVQIAVAVVEWNDHFLVGQRPAGILLAGLFEFPGGKLHDDESLEQAAVRECFEETGVQVAIEGLHAHVEHEYEHGHVALHFFSARPLSDQPNPKAPYKWVPRQDLGRLAFPAANRALIATLTHGHGSTTSR